MKYADQHNSGALHSSLGSVTSLHCYLCSNTSIFSFLICKMRGLNYMNPNVYATGKHTTLSAAQNQRENRSPRKKQRGGYEIGDLNPSPKGSVLCFHSNEEVLQGRPVSTSFTGGWLGVGFPRQEDCSMQSNIWRTIWTQLTWLPHPARDNLLYFILILILRVPSCLALHFC